MPDNISNTTATNDLSNLHKCEIKRFPASYKGTFFQMLEASNLGMTLREGS